MENRKTLILVSNDDGVQAPGLHYLIECVKKNADVIVVAPDDHRSGQSSAITVNSPLMVHEHTNFDGAKVYSVNGTPVDCIKLAMHAIVPRKPDLMVCGINHGTNAGNCVLYSGTMGAVLEAASVGIPSIGFSLLHYALEADFSKCGPIVEQTVAAVLKNGLPDRVCLNVNIPAKCTPKGLKIVRAAHSYWTEEYADYTTPHGQPCYWLTGKLENKEIDNPATDLYWLDREYATAVPVSVDQTAISAIDRIANILH